MEKNFEFFVSYKLKFTNLFIILLNAIFFNRKWSTKHYLVDGETAFASDSPKAKKLSELEFSKLQAKVFEKNFGRKHRQVLSEIIKSFVAEATKEEMKSILKLFKNNLEILDSLDRESKMALRGTFSTSPKENDPDWNIWMNLHEVDAVQCRPCGNINYFRRGLEDPPEICHSCGFEC